MNNTPNLKKMKNMNIFKKTALISSIILLSVVSALAQSDVLWKKNFGGSDIDWYNSVTAVPDGLVAVGYSYPLSFGNGDWEGVTGNGGYDAIIVKYDSIGNVVWKKNFGGSGYIYDAWIDDHFFSVTAVTGGVVAVGYSREHSFNSGDWEGVMGKGYDDAIIVKFDDNGNVVWKKNFGGSSGDYYYSVTAISDGVVAVGYSTDLYYGFDTGDWEGFTGQGSDDAIIVKYDNEGNVIWKKNFGGIAQDAYWGVTAVSDGIVAVGTSMVYSFNTGDWEGIMAKGPKGYDAIIVKYDHDGNVMWKKNFGGAATSGFSSVIAVSDGIVAVGSSQEYCFNNGDWEGVIGKGGDDAIIVKFDNEGNIVWKKNFGGAGYDHYYSITDVTDGIVAVGYSIHPSFGNGDWVGVTGNGGYDAIVVKYDNAGNVVWKRNFGGHSADIYYSVTAISDGIVAVGCSYVNGSGDWAGVPGNGDLDAFIVKYGVKYEDFVPVTDITDVPTTVTVNIPLTLTGTIEPSNATNQNIVWSIKDAGTTKASIIGNTFNATAAGTAEITAIITDGIAIGTPYTQDFSIDVSTIGIIETVTDKISIYPNPTSGELRIESVELNIENVAVFDVYGRKQMAESKWQKADGVVVIDVSHLQVGIYFVKISTEVGEIIKKVIKQ
jgi:hypothetical protein